MRQASINIIKKNFTIMRSSLGASLLWMFTESTIMFLVLGFGVGSLIPNVGVESYLKFFAPGFILANLMYVSFSETGLVFYNKFKNRKVMSSYLLLPIGIEDIIIGEMLWGALKGLMSSILLIVLCLLTDTIMLQQLPLFLLMLVLSSLLFSSMGMTLTSLYEEKSFYIYFQCFYFIPMFFLSGVFFPIESLPNYLYAIAMVFPLTHAVMAAKTLMSLDVDSTFFINLSVLFVYGFIFSNIYLGKMKKKYNELSFS